MAARGGGYWGYFRHDWDEVGRQLGTHSDTFRLPIPQRARIIRLPRRPVRLRSVES